MPRSLPQILIWIFCLSWAFDFRGQEEGGSAIQFVFFAITVTSAALIVGLGFRFLFVQPTGWLVLGWLVYLASTLIVALVNGVEMGWYFRNVSQPLLLWCALSVTQVAAGSGQSPRTVLVPMLVAGCVNVVWRAFYSLQIAAVPLDEVRVQMLSQCLPFLLAYGIATLVLRREISWLALGITALCLASYALSVTRSAILILLAEILAALLVLYRCHRNRWVPASFVGRKGAHLLVGATAVAGLLTVLGLTTNVLSRWDERLFHAVGSEYTSADPSTLTRLAETKSFYDLLNEEPATWLYGKGLGAAYYWDEAYIPELLYTYGNAQEFRGSSAEVRFPGHSIWTYSLFSGGIIGLLAYAALFLLAVWISWRSAGLLAVRPDYPASWAFLPFIALVGFLSLSLTFNPFIERASVLALGCMIGFPQFLIHLSRKKR